MFIGYSYADLTCYIETRRSTYGYTICSGANLGSGSLKKETHFLRCSFESEYQAMTNSTAELTWIPHPFRDLNALPTECLMLLCDNIRSIFLNENPVAHKRVKHIDIDHHFVRELVFSEKLNMKFVTTKL